MTARGGTSFALALEHKLPVKCPLARVQTVQANIEHIFGIRWRRWIIAALSALAGQLLAAGAAQAQVIEIADDGTAQVIASSSAAIAVRRVPAGFDIDAEFASAARRYQVDLGLLRAVAWQESRGHNNAVSPKGALGLMQLMPGTAAQMGVDPRDPASNIHGGAAYLAQQIATFGSVPLGLAAYNAGPGAVQKYGGVPPYAETRGYVATIMQRWSGAPGAVQPALKLAHPHVRTVATLLIEVPGE